MRRAAVLISLAAAFQPARQPQRSKNTRRPTATQEPPPADSDAAKRADGMAAKLAGAIEHAQSVEAMQEVLDKGDAVYAHLTAESELRKENMLSRNVFYFTM